MTTRYTTTFEAPVDEPVENRRDSKRHSELSSERQQRVAASQLLTRPLFDTVPLSNAEIGVVKLVQGAESNHGDPECARRHHATDKQRLRSARAERSMTDDAQVAVYGNEEDHESGHVHRDSKDGEYHATQSFTKHLFHNIASCSKIAKYLICYAPPRREGGIIKWAAVSVRLSVCLFVCPVPNSRTERPRKPKIGRMEAHQTGIP